MLYGHLAIFITYTLLAYVSHLELQLYKLAEVQNVKDKFIYKPYKILLYFILGLIHLIIFYKK
jgi:hypothetical protein